MIATNGIPPFSMTIRRFELSKVSRLLIVLFDLLVIQFY